MIINHVRSRDVLLSFHRSVEAEARHFTALRLIHRSTCRAVYQMRKETKLDCVSLLSVSHLGKSELLHIELRLTLSWACYQLESQAYKQ